MLHAPALQPTQNNEKVATYAQNFEDAPYASVTTRRKQREGRHCSRDLRPEFRRCSTRQRHDAPETARRSPLTSRISRTLHAPAPRHAENNETVATYAQNFKDAPRASIISRTLDAPAPRHAKNNEKVTTVVAIYAQNFEDAPRASVTTRWKQREGRHLRPEFRGRSTLQRHDAPTTGSPLTRRSRGRLWRKMPTNDE